MERREQYRTVKVKRSEPFGFYGGKRLPATAVDMRDNGDSDIREAADM